MSAVKGLAEVGQIPVVALSRLHVLARKAGVPSAALDAHRKEIFLRVERAGQAAQELLAGAPELAAMDPGPIRLAVCDEAAAELLIARANELGGRDNMTAVVVRAERFT